MTDTLRDWRHAARIFVDDTFTRAPRTKFLFYVVFNVNPSSKYSSDFKNRYGSELNYLVKDAELPKYEIQNEVLNQYNRKTTAYSKIVYQPVSITLHDDNHGTSNAMYAAYYSHYFQDQNYTTNTGVAPETYKKTTYQSMPNALYGYAGAPVQPFFDSIQIVTMSKKTFQSYLLCNPKISSWSHDTMDYSEGGGVVENKLSLVYDAVIYDSGTVSIDQPSGFAKLHYDIGPSPIADTAPKPNPDAGQDLNLRQNAQPGTFLKPPVSVNYGNNSSLLGSSTPIIPQLLSGNSIYNTGGMQDIGFGGYNTINGFVPASAVGTDIYQGAGSDIFGAPVINSQDFNSSFGGIQGTTGAGTSGNFQSDQNITTGVNPTSSGTTAPFTGDRAAYYGAMYEKIYNAAVDANVPNPSVIAQLGAAQSTVETGGGQHMVGNNAFGIKGVGDQGTVTASTREVLNGQSVTLPQGFAKYSSLDASAAGYVAFLQKNKRYSEVLKSDNIEDAVKAIGKSGYATDPNYAKSVYSAALKGDAALTQTAANSTSDVDAPLPPRRPEDLGGKPAPEETASTATNNPEQQENPAGETVATNDVNTVSNPEETYQPDASPVETAASEPAPEPDYGSYTLGA